MKNTIKLLALIALLLGCRHQVLAQEVLDLTGYWNFETDKKDIGINEHWYDKQLKNSILLPGSMPQRLKGDKPTIHTQWTGSLYDSSYYFNPHMEKYRQAENIKFPFFLTPDRHYVGVAWYKRTFELPKNWKKRRVVLYLERPHITTTLWINGKQVGTENSLCVPHVYNITDYISSGKNTIALRIDNRIEELCVGADSHSVTDQTQGNWNGIVGRIELQSTPFVFIHDIQVYPDIYKKQAVVKITIHKNNSPKSINTEIKLSARSFNSTRTHCVPELTQKTLIEQQQKVVEVILPLGESMLLWDEFNPALYKLTVDINTGKEKDKRSCTFGMRDFRIEGKMFYINGRKTILRGTVENCDFPLTGYAPMDVESWERVFRICRQWGLNHIRFHSYCPPEAAFKAADLVGFYLQPEGPSWPNHGVKLGNGMPIDKYLLQETQRMNKVYGNYASFCMLACGNEPAGNWVKWVSDFVTYWKKTDHRHVYTGASVGGSWAWQPLNMYHVKAGARGLGEWNRGTPESVSDYRDKIGAVKEPYVSHETGQWCAFPDFDEISQYTGVNKACNFEIFRDILNENDMIEMAQKFHIASGKLQALCYKYELERTFLTPDYAGFQLLALNDYSGQGTALVGLLNVFFNEKKYITAQEFREFCSPTVLLARIPKFTYWNNESFKAALEIAHYGYSPIRNATVKYTIKDNYNKIYVQGFLPTQDIELGGNNLLGSIPPFELKSLNAKKLTLEVAVNGSQLNGETIEPIEIKNHWSFWVYPTSTLEYITAPQSQDVYICDTLNDKALETLKNKGKVLIIAAGKISYGREVVQHFLPVFWNTSWFKMRPPHTTGLYINNSHPLFKDFPSDYYSDLQWWDLVNRQQVMQFTEFPKGFQPIIQSIDTWFLSRKIGMLFEANVGNGKLIMTTMPLYGNSKEQRPYENCPAVAQMRKAILSYMQSDNFRPAYRITTEQIRILFSKEVPKMNMHTLDSPDELKSKIK